MKTSAESSPVEVSFVVPCFKLAHFLDECVRSILGQTFRRLEVIVMDDCSPDETPRVAEQLVNADSRVRYIRHPVNVGCIANFNAGLALATGDFVTTISADDLLLDSTVVERYVARFRKSSNVGLIHSKAHVFRGQTPIVAHRSSSREVSGRLVSSRDMLRQSAISCPCGAPTVMLRRSIVEDVGGFHRDLPRAADWHMWAAAGARSDVYYFEEPMIGYRLHGTNMEATLRNSSPDLYWDQLALVLWRIWDEAFAHGYADLWPLFRERLAQHYAFRILRWNVDKWPNGFSIEEAGRRARDAATRDDDATDVLNLIEGNLVRLASRAYKDMGHEYHALLDKKESFRCFMKAWRLRPSDYRALVLAACVGFESASGIAVKHRVASAVRWTSKLLRRGSSA